MSKSMWSLLPWVGLTQGFTVTFRDLRVVKGVFFPADVPLATSFHTVCFTALINPSRKVLWTGVRFLALHGWNIH